MEIFWLHSDDGNKLDEDDVGKVLNRSERIFLTFSKYDREAFDFGLVIRILKERSKNQVYSLPTYAIFHSNKNLTYS